MPHDDARYYLYRVMPWNGLNKAFVNIHWAFRTPDRAVPAFAGRPCSTIDECVRAAVYAESRNGTEGVFLCMSTQREYMEQQFKNGGGMFRKAIRNHNNAEHLKTLYIDVDVRKDKAYPDFDTALHNIQRFYVAAGIPQPSLMVNTGGGIHIYWVLDNAISVATWQPLANALAEATRRHGLLCDVGCTVDAARLMRLPSTTNRKPDREPAVVGLVPGSVLTHDYTLDQMKMALTPYMGAQVIQLTPKGNINHNDPRFQANDELAGGIEPTKAPPVDLDTIAAAGCRFIAEALASNGATYDQPLWNLTTLVSTFTIGGRADAHRMASGHKGYVNVETDALYDRKEKERAEKDLGWPSCNSVENAGCKECATCPIRTPISRPLQFGKSPNNVVPIPAGMNPIMQTSTDDVPIGYQRNANGHISKHVLNKDGTTTLAEVINYPMIEPWLQDDPWTLHFMTRTDLRPTPKQISVTLEQINTAEGFGKTLGFQGIPLNKNQNQALREFIVAWIGRLKQMKDKVVSSAAFGWSTPNGVIDGFSYAGRVWSDGEDRPTANPDPVLIKRYTPKGELEPWIAAAKLITDLNTPERDAMLAATLAAPLVKFTNKEGIFISAYSKGSGHGKTSVMMTAQAMWGNPVDAMEGLDDTSNSLFNKMGAIRSLPLFWDEIKTKEQFQNFVRILFSLTRGREKNRMDGTGHQREGGSWQTLLMSASNDSIIHYVARETQSTTAGVFRVFEFPVGPIVSPLNSAEADLILDKVKQNYGRAGLVYSQFLGANHKRIAKEVHDLQVALIKRLNGQTPERFWIAAVTCMFLGARYGNELKLTQINEPALLKFLLGVFANMRNGLKGQTVDLANPDTVSNVLQQFLGAMRSKNTLHTNRMQPAQGRAPKGYIKVVADTSRLDRIFVHVARQERVMYVSLTQLKTWLDEGKYSAHHTIEALQKEFKAETTQAIMGGGTDFAVTSMKEQVLKFDINNPSMKKFMDYD